ncbi:MAG: allantoicase, partial [Gemmatimonadales bacterium]
PGHDWCIIRLGVPGVIRSVTADTNHFRGNNPEACSLDALRLTRATEARRLAALGDAWVEIVPRSPLTGHAEHELAVRADAPFTHVRLNIFPDGGVARLRVWGEARPDWSRIAAARRPVDLAAALSGGVPLLCSDQFFSEPLNLIMPGRPANMGDGWETRRRRGAGHDWVVLRLGRRGAIETVEVDTTHFKGNYPESCRLEGLDAPGATGPTVPDTGTGWREILPRAKLRAHRRHRFPVATGARRPVTHVRLSIFPDGGVSRLRLWGRPAE